MEKIKMIRVEENTHTKIKMYSAKRNMTMQDYIAYCVELDEDVMNREEKNLLQFEKDQK